MRKLNIGCGEKIKEGYEGLDTKDFGQKYVMDISAFCGSSRYEMFDEIYAEHFLEHFNQDELKKVFRDMWEVLKFGGIFKIIVPSKEKDESWVLTHKTFFTEYTFKVFDNPIFAYEFCGGFEWRVKELRTNERKDIYCELIKI